MTVRLLHGDCREVLRTLPDASVHSVVTDPPYELGFMGKGWDRTGIAYDPAVWREVLRVLKPGGHLLAFSGTRTYHRMVCAIEDAGFEVRDQIGWVYGSGFPKSLDVSKAIDKAAGAAREVVGERRKLQSYGSGVNAVYGGGPDKGNVQLLTAPVTDAARQWQGWGTALKPAWEPIVLARKPLGTVAVDVLANVEDELRRRGVEGIRWSEPVNAAARRGRRPTSSSIGAPPAAATSADPADAPATASGERPTASNAAPSGSNGATATPTTLAPTPSASASNCATPSSPPMGLPADAAERPSGHSSPSTTSTEAAPLTAAPFTERSTSNCGATASRPGIESFAGIATGLTGSLEHARINRLPDGSFEWPDGLPRYVPATDLTVAANVLAHGTGAMNIDGCRVATYDKLGGGNENLKPRAHTEGWDRPWMHDESATASRSARVRDNVEKAEALGRWPANIVHDGSDEVLAAFAQFGESASRKGKPRGSAKPGEGWGMTQTGAEYDDAGSAARFFYSAKASASDRTEGLHTVSRGGRNHHPTVKPTDLMRWLCRLVTPPGGTVLDPFMGSGSTLKAAELEGFDAVGIELEAAYLEIARQRIGADAPLFCAVLDVEVMP